MLGDGVMAYSGCFEANGSVLVVDDEAAVRRVLEKLLKTGGYEVVQAGNGDEALAMLAEREFDTVLLDVMMPGTDGVEVCRRIRAQEHGQYTPVVFLSATNTPEFRRRATQAGADDTLCKPFDAVELLARVRNTMRLKQGMRALERERQNLQTAYRAQQRALDETLHKLESVREELELAQRETLLRLNRAAEFRDDETAGHLQRMSWYSRLIGEKLGMGLDELERLQAASPMHDVGKIGIPDSILLKPGKLTAEELEIMRQHAEIGYRILSGSNSPLLVMAARIARSHHEKWDGSGYPLRLKGADIPLEGRIVAIADVFDALTSERPYKKAWPVEDAIALLRREQGRHFDPELTELFLNAMPDVEDIRQRFQEGGPTLLAAAAV